MGEIFKRPLPRQSLSFTGERFTSEAVGQIEVEHYHRYLLAREYCCEKDVLDVACGEGYGSALLAECAHSVIGVDVDNDSIQHAQQAYTGPRYVVGDATSIPIDDQSVDVVVSFETLEHFRDHTRFMGEVRRVLRPGGLLIISTPERDLYTPPNAQSNPYHVKELTRPEFMKLMNEYFANTYLYLQRAILGSAVLLESAVDVGSRPVVFEKRGEALFEKSIGMPRAPYMIALASDQEINIPSSTLYFETGEPYQHISAMNAAFRAEEARLHAELVRADEREVKFREAEAAFRAEEARLHAELVRADEREVKFREAEAAFRAEEARLHAELEQAKLASQQKVNTSEALNEAGTYKT